MPNKLKPWYKNYMFWLKLLLTGFSLFYIFKVVPFNGFIKVLKEVGVWEMIAALLAVTISKIISSFRLNKFFRQGGINLSERYNLKLYWLGMFYNQFLPGGIGGDGYKVIYLNDKTGKGIKLITSLVLADRLSGLTALASLSFILGCFVFPIWWAQLGFIVGLPLLYFGYLLLCKFFLAGNIRFHLTRELYSWGVQLFQLLAAACLLFALHIHSNQQTYLFVFLFSSVVSVLPISLGGLGTREFAFVFASQYLEMDAAQAAAVGFLFYFINLISSLPGIWFVFFSMNHKPLAED